MRLHGGGGLWSRRHLWATMAAMAVAIPGGAHGQPLSPPDEGLRPALHGLVSPQTLDMNLSQTTEAVRALEWAEGQSVRVVEDLKEAAGPTPPVEGPQPRRAMAPEFAAPVAGVNFDGIPATGVLPPDTVGDVGPNHYIQMVNTAFAIYDKTGNLLAGPTLINAPLEPVRRARARARTTATRSSATTIWPTAGCSASSPCRAAPKGSTSASPSHAPPIRSPVAGSSTTSRPSTAPPVSPSSPTIPRSGSGPTPTTWARSAASRTAGSTCGRSIARACWPARRQGWSSSRSRGHPSS